MTDRRTLIETPLISAETAHQWIVEMHAAGLMFHLDDDPATVGNIVEGRWSDLFTIAEGEHLVRRKRELFTLLGDPHYDACVVTMGQAECDEIGLRPQRWTAAGWVDAVRTAE